MDYEGGEMKRSSAGGRVMLSRRALLQAAVGLPLLGLGALAREWNMSAASAAPLQLVLTSPCDDGDADPTDAQTEGPFFAPASPNRISLIEQGVDGTRLQLTGQVFSTSCVPVAGALLDFWHADNDGAYDLDGDRLRGHQFTDAEGRFRLETVMPGPYPGRTRHIHVKVQAASGPILTTQLYFPGESRNRRDGIYSDSLLMRLASDKDERRGAFDFVVRLK